VCDRLGFGRRQLVWETASLLLAFPALLREDSCTFRYTRACFGVLLGGRWHGKAKRFGNQKEGYSRRFACDGARRRAGLA
jgi:hypothetical protein